MKRDPSADNSRVAVSSAEFSRFQERILGISGRQNSTPMVASDWQGITSY